MALERRLAPELAGVDAVLLEEWPAVEHPSLTEVLIRLRPACGYALLLRDAHSRVLTEPLPLRGRLDRFDAVLVYGPSMADEYQRGLGVSGVHVLHEAADVALFRPHPHVPTGTWDDAVFIGNWGEGDRAAELRRFLLRPARRFGGRRRFAVHGVRYPPEALEALAAAGGVEYRGWLPNYLVPQAFARARVALHVIRRQYAEWLHGVPTIRVFEALACGLPLVSTRWRDTDGLFREGQDYLLVDTPAQMEEALDWLWHDGDARARLGRNGRLRVLDAHTCAHRAEQLLEIVAGLQALWPARAPRAAGEEVPATVSGGSETPATQAVPALPVRQWFSPSSERQVWRSSAARPARPARL